MPDEPVPDGPVPERRKDDATVPVVPPPTNAPIPTKVSKTAADEIVNKEVDAHIESEAKKAESVRKNSLIWEVTQSAIALGSMGTAIAVVIIGAIRGVEANIPDTLEAIIFVIIGFYFARGLKSTGPGGPQ